MKTGETRRTYKAFTLIELLIVMGILGLLFAILMPGIGAVRRSAYRNQAKQEIKAVESAMLAFLTEYGRFPLQTNSGSPDSGNAYGDPSDLAPESDPYKDLIDSLRGNDADDNPRNSIFLTIKERSIDLDTDQFVDPWLNRYAIVADWNMDGQVETGLSGVDATLENNRVAVWSWGPDASGADASEFIKSWTLD